jgi:hypothetical protein
MLVVGRVDRGRVDEGAIFLVGRGICGPEAGISRVFEQAAGLIIFIMQIVKILDLWTASLRSTDGAGVWMVQSAVRCGPAWRRREILWDLAILAWFRSGRSVWG